MRATQRSQVCRQAFPEFEFGKSICHGPKIRLSNILCLQLFRLPPLRLQLLSLQLVQNSVAIVPPALLPVRIAINLEGSDVPLITEV